MSTSLYRQIDCLIDRLYEFYVKWKKKKEEKKNVVNSGYRAYQ